MTKKQLIIEIVNANSGYTVTELLKLWYAELKVLHYAVTKEKHKKGTEQIYGIE